MKDKKGIIQLTIPVVVLILGVLVIALVARGDVDIPFLAAAGDGPETSSPGIELTGLSCKEQGALSKKEDALLRWNDIDQYASGTDPGSNLFLYKGFASISDDGTRSMAIGTETEVVYGDTSTSYFREKGLLCIPDEDPVDVTHKLSAGGAPTLTILNPNGKVNSDSDDIAVGASGVLTFVLRAQSPADQCSAHPDYGAVVIINYDRDVYQTWDSSLPTYGKAITGMPLHDANVTTALADAQVAFLFSGEELCNNKILDIGTFTGNADSDNPGEDDGNVQIDYFPIQPSRSTEDDSFIIGIQNDAGTLQQSGSNTTATVYAS